MRRRDTPCIELVSYGLHSLLWGDWLQVVQMKNPIKVVTIPRGNHSSVRWILKRTAVPVYGVGISFPATFFVLRLTPFIGHLLFIPTIRSENRKTQCPLISTCFVTTREATPSSFVSLREREMPMSSSSTTSSPSITYFSPSGPAIALGVESHPQEQR